MKGKMKRRDFLARGALGAGGGALLAGCSPAGEQAPAIIRQRVELRMVTSWPKNFPGLGTAAERVAQKIAAASGGRIRITLYAAGELVPALESFDAVSSGAADMYHAAEYYWQGKHPAYNFFTAIPFGMTYAEQNGWIYYGGGQKLWDTLAARFNIKPMMVANTGTQMGGWFARPLKSLADLRGLKIRIPGLGGEVYRRLGAQPVTLAGGDIFPSLQSGKIDAAEWIGPWNDLAFGFHKIMRFCHWPGFHEPGAALALGINLNVWNGLTKEDQAIIANVAAAENIHSYADFTHNNAAALDALQRTHGVEFLPFPPDILQAFRTTARTMLREEAEKDSLFAEIYQHYQAAQAKAAKWTRIAEQGYLNAREA